MNTTALLVDILLIGIQVLAWISGLLFSFIFFPSQIVAFSEIAPAPFLFGLLALTYTLGITFDYIIASAFKHFKSTEQKKAQSGISVIDILHHDKEMHSYLENQAARLRIARATAFNLPLITIASICYVLSNSLESRLSVYGTSLWILSLGLAMTTLAVFSFKTRNKVYWRYYSAAREIVNGKK